MLLFFNQILYYDGKNYSWGESCAHLIPFYISFSEYVEKLIICTPVQKVNESLENNLIPIDSGKIKVIPLPYFLFKGNLHKELMTIIPRTIYTAVRSINSVNLVGCVSGSIMGTIFSLVTKIYHKPMFFLVLGNKKRVLTENTEKGIKRSIILFVASVVDCLTRIMMKQNSVTFVVGDELFKLYNKENNSVYKITPHSYLTFTRSLTNPSADLNEARNTHKTVTRLLYIGSLRRLKGLEYLIKAVKMVKQKHNTHLDLVGSGDDEERLKEMVKNMELMPYVSFRGHIPHSQALIRLYKSSDIFILPSMTEGVPSVILEAMKMGIPVIATSVGSVPYIISHGENGLLVSPRNPDEIADNIIKLIENPSLREKIVGNAHKYVENLPSFYEQRDEMAKILSSKFNLAIGINRKEGEKHG